MERETVNAGAVKRWLLKGEMQGESMNSRNKSSSQIEIRKMFGVNQKKKKKKMEDMNLNQPFARRTLKEPL